ncbi:MAG: two-component regulator propeller domain-containing protein [Bacteroidales bacterium]|nr:two-component regulator propeller domain-containing protein [Bacteroidales bacterium]
MATKYSYRIFFTVQLVLSLFLQESYSQHLRSVSFEQIKTENIKRVQGLSQNMVNTIIQDQRGFLWFGTWDGLNRYDGYDFRIFNKQSGMSNTTINTLLEDDHGYIWAGTQDGLHRLDPSNMSVKVIEHDPGKSNSLSNNTINHICQDREGILWISTVQGLNKYDKNNDAYTRYSFHFSNADSIRTNWINKVIQDKEGIFWIASRFGLFKFDAATQLFTPFFFDHRDKSSISSNDINEIYEDSRGRLWIGTQNGLNLYLDESRGFKRFMHENDNPQSLSNNEVNAVFEDSRGNLWIGTRNKLNLFNSDAGTFKHFGNTMKNNSLSDNDINCIFEDDMGSIWIGTYNGVNKLNTRLSKFNYYQREPENPNALSSNIIYSIFKDDENLIWLGTGKGVNIFNREEGEYRQLHHMINPYTDLADLRIRCLHNDSHGHLWIATDRHGLFKYEPSNEKFICYKHEENKRNTLSSNNTLWVTEDHTGYIWLGTDRGVNAFHPDSSRIRSWMHNPNDPGSISSNQIWVIYEDIDDNLWFGTDNGLNCYYRESDRFISYTYDADDPGSISANAVYGIHEDSKGNLWVGTMGGGLNLFDPESEIFTHYDEQDGLPNNVVYIALEDKNGKLWLTTNWGMSKFDPETGEFVNYGINDGLQGNEFNGGAWHHARDGEMFFGGMHGFNSFYPEQISENKTPPRIVITDFRKFNTSVKKEFRDGDTIRLNYNDNFFSISFSALDFTNPGKNKYRYILENYDGEWINRDADRRIAEYTRVEPGTYTFRVTGSNSDGYWNTEGCSLHIIILPPWYDTLVFRIIFGALIFALLWAFVYWRIQSVKKKHEVEKKMLTIEKALFEIQQKALQLQMNPHFIFNSLNAIQSFVISNDTDKAIHYLSKFSQLMRMILANSRETSIPLKEELKAVKHYMDIERLRFDNNFDYEIRIDPTIDQDFTEIPPMIIQPFVENAILHGLIHSPGRGRITIDIRQQGDYLFCVIEDNGIGRKKAQQIKDASGIKRKSRGVIITRERLEILNKQSRDKFAVNVIDLKDQHGHPTGTRVELNILYFDD